MSPEHAGQRHRPTLMPPLRAGIPRNAPQGDLFCALRAHRARKPNLLGSSAPTRAQADGKSSVQLQVFASSGPSGTALAGHFYAQRCTCYPSQAWAWAKACLSAATAKPLKSEEYPLNTNEATTSNIATLPANPKPRTSREVIQANVQLLMEQLEAGHSEGLTAYLTAMGRFHNYSFGNILEIARQRPDATRVAGLYAWNQLGRKVIRGQKGIRILAPMIGTRKKKDTEANKSKDPAAVNSPVLYSPDTYVPVAASRLFYQDSSISFARMPQHMDQLQLHRHRGA